MDEEKWYDELWDNIYSIVLDTEYTDQIQGLVKSKVKQVIKEFMEAKVKPLLDELVELMFADDEPHCKVENCYKGDDIPCNSSVCIEENKQVWRNRLDKLIKDNCE